MVFRGDDDVFHASVFCDLHPFPGIKLYRIKLCGELFIIGARDVGPIHYPFTDSVRTLALVLTGGNSVETPMNKHSKSRFAPPTHTLIVLHSRFRLACKDRAALPLAKHLRR